MQALRVAAGIVIILAWWAVGPEVRAAVANYVSYFAVPGIGIACLLSAVLHWLPTSR